jgi:type I restriction enzyme S subunit
MTSRNDFAGHPATAIERVGAVRLGRQRSPSTATGDYMTKYIRAGNITDRGLDLSDVFKMNFEPQERQIYGLRNNDILLVEGSGSAQHVGKSAIWRDEIEECCFQNTVIRFRAHAVDARYALIVFRHYVASGVFAQTARGIGILHLGAARFANLSFPLPPSEDQINIVAVVDERTSEIRETREALESALTRIAEQEKEILSQMANGTLPITTAPQKDDNSQEDSRNITNKERGAPLIQQALPTEGGETSVYPWAGVLPDGWHWVQMSDIADIKIGRSRSPKNSQGSNMRPYLRVANVLEDRLDLSTITYMNFTEEEFAQYRLEPDDVLLNDGQSPELVGRPAIYRGDPPGVCYQNHIIRFRPGPDVDPEFAVLVFRHYLHAGHFRAIARWTTNIATLSLKRFSAMPFPLPDIRQQRQLASEARYRLDSSDEQRRMVIDSLKRLPLLEEEILFQAVRGALRWSQVWGLGGVCGVSVQSGRLCGR